MTAYLIFGGPFDLTCLAIPCSVDNIVNMASWQILQMQTYCPQPPPKKETNLNTNHQSQYKAILTVAFVFNLVWLRIFYYY